MNYFLILNVQESTILDKDLLKSNYYKLSKENHPDKFINDGIEKILVMQEKHALINKAYTTLKDDEKRLDYYLACKDIIDENEKYNLTPEFLMEMMEINEAIDENEVPENMKNILETIQNQLDENLESIYTMLQNATEEITYSAKNILRKYYYERKYLLRIKKRLLTFAVPK